MTQPLALLWHDKSLLVNRLSEKLDGLGYRTQSLRELDELVETAERCQPLVAFVGVDAQTGRITEILSQLRNNQATAHLPVIALVSTQQNGAAEAVLAAGAKLAVPDNVVLDYLEQYLQQALELH